MNFNDYQAEAKETAIYPEDYAVVYPTLGLASESGEIASKVKKCIRDHTQFDRQDMVRELGDVLWYVAAIASDLGITLQEVAEANINKLSSRKERGTLSGSGDDR